MLLDAINKEFAPPETEYYVEKCPPHPPHKTKSSTQNEDVAVIF